VGYDGYNDKHRVAGYPKDEVGDTLWIRPESVPGANNQTSKDNLVPDSLADTVLVYAGSAFAFTDSVAGTKFQNDIFKVVVFGFGFEAINSCGCLHHNKWLSKPHFVMQRVLNWLRGTTDVFDEEEEFVNLPRAIQLHQNYPNPFNPSTQIPFTVYGSQFTVHGPIHTTQGKAVHGSWFTVHGPIHTTQGKAVHGSWFTVHGPIHTTLKIYNVLGQVVRILVDEEKLPGSYTVIWDGKDQNGKEVSSGIYFYQLKTKDLSEVKKMVLLK
jgi:hypothetical protein